MRKRQWKKVLSLVLALAMVFSMNTSVFAAEVQAPEATPAVETEAPAPAETPEAEAPAAEEPAPAEAPAAETPAAETPAAEAPAAEEPAKEEAVEAAPAEEAPKAEEAAAEVSEAEVKEEAAEAAPAAEVEEAAGEAIDWKTETDEFKVYFLASSGALSTNTAKVAKKDPTSTSADYIISVNGTIVGNEQIVVEAKDGQAPSINKIYISADSAVSIDSLKSLVLSGNAIAYNGGKIYRNDTGDELTGWEITLNEGYVYSQTSGVINKLNHKLTINSDFDVTWIYKDSPVSMTVSVDKWSASFNETVTEVYNASLATAPLYKGVESKDVKLENIGDSGISEVVVFVRRANGYLASVDIVTFNSIPEKGVSVDAAVASATSKVVSVNVTKGTHYIVYSKEEWGERGDEKDLIDFAPETGWKEIKGGEISVNFAGPNQTKYVLIRNKATNNTLTRYDYLELISRAEVPTTGWVSQDGIWSARQTNGESTPLEVWVNDTNPSKLLISGNVTKGVDIALEAKSESADTIDQIIISGDEVGEVTFVPSTNKIGTKFNDPTVYSQSGNQLDDVKTSDTATGITPLVVDKGAISVNGAGPNVIPEGAEVFAAVWVNKEPAGYAKVSYNDVTLTLSDNASAVYVFGTKYQGMLETPQEFKKDTAGDVFDYVADKAAVFFDVTDSDYVKTKYAIYGFDEATFEKPATLAIGDYHYNYFTPSNFDADTEYAVSSESGNTAEFYRGLNYYIKNKTGEFKVTSTNGVKDDLEQGQTYYVYGFKKGNGTSTFSGYGEVGNVTLGISANFAIEANADGHGFLVNDKIDGTMVSWDAVPGQNVKIGGVDHQVTRALIEDYAKAFDGTYSVSSNDKFSPAGTLTCGSATPAVDLKTKGKWLISINDIDAKTNYAKDEIKAHNTINITLKNGTFPVGDKDSEIKVTLPDYYYGLDEYTFLDKADAVLDGISMKAYNLVAQYGESVSSDGNIVKPFAEKFKKVETLSAGSTFAARFYLGDVGQAPSTNAVTVSVNKMPLNISAERNFFSVQGADLAEAKAIDKKEIIIKDLYGTAYEARVKEEKDDYIKDVKPDFSTVEYKAEGDMAKIKGRQDYGLNVTLADALSKNAANYEITKTNAEKFGYYVAPVYEVAFKGSALKAVKYEGKELQKKELKSGGAAFVASVSSAAAKKFPPADKYARQTDVSDVYDVTAEVVLPKTSDNASANEIVLNGSSTFVSWMRDKKAVSGKDKISDNGVVYNANVKEGVIGFDPKNGLAVTIVNEDDITFTGLNHVSDYHEQFENPSANRPGTDAAKEKTRQTALKNSGDVDLQVWVGDTLLVENYDYVVKYKNNKNAYSLEGKTSADINKKAPQVTITFKNGYATYPTVTKYFSINPADIEDITTGCGVDSRIVKKAAASKTADKVFTKTDLVNVNTGAALKFNKTEAKSDVAFTVDGDIHAEGEVKVTVKGLNNYTGEKDVTVYIVDKVKWTTVNINKGKPDGTNEAIPFTNEDTLEPNQSTIENEIKAAVAAKDSSATDLEEIVLYRAKGGYVLPGAKKVAFKTIAVVNGKATGFKGNYKYKIAPVTKAQLDEMKPEWTIPTDGVPFVKAGATVAVEDTYNGSDCMKLFKVGFANNKKPGTATAKLTAANGAYFDKDAKTALKADPFVKTFTINKAKLNENIHIKSAYVAEGDGTDVKKIAKTGGIVITDEMGAILKANSDYTIDSFSNDTNKVKLKAKGKNFEGETEIDVTKVNPYLGTCTVAFDKGAPKKIKEADIEKLESGEMTNADFASAYKLVVKNGRNTLTQVNNSISGNNFNFVVTKAKVGGKCYIQAVGCDGGAFGGSDVLAKKQVNKTVE